MPDSSQVTDTTLVHWHTFARGKRTVTAMHPNFVSLYGGSLGLRIGFARGSG